MFSQMSKVRQSILILVIVGLCVGCDTRNAPSPPPAQVARPPASLQATRSSPAEKRSEKSGQQVSQEIVNPPGEPDEKAYNELDVWEPEAEPYLARQRPVALLVICEDYGTSCLTTPVKVTLPVAEQLAHCGYDVRIMVGVFDASKASQHPTVGTVSSKSLRINERIKSRNENEKVASGIAPLKLLSRPEVFSTQSEFWELFEHWLQQTFHSPTKEIRKKTFVHGRPPFGMIYFNGHGGWHERPARWARGKTPKTQSIYRDVFYAPPDYDLISQNDAPPRMENEISIQGAALTASLQYQAPLWICADMCREHIVDGPGGRPTSAPVRMSLMPRQLKTDGVELDARLAKGVENIEELRRTAIASNTAFDEFARHATLLFPDEQRRSVLDSENLSLGFHIANHISVSSPIQGFNPHFPNANGKPTVLTLAEIFESVRDQIRFASKKMVGKKVSMNPRLDPGPIDEAMVVAAAMRDSQYPQIYLNFLPGNLSVDSGLTGFSVPCDSEKMVLGNEVFITREQPQFSNDFRAYFELIRKPQLLPKRAYKLILKVRATSNNPKHKIGFVVGAYNQDKESLTSHFTNYAAASSTRLPIPCDGVEYLRETPLDDHRNSLDQLSFVEIQSVPSTPDKSWPLGATLTITEAYIVSADTTLDDFEKGMKASNIRQASNNLIPQWWCMTPLGAQPHESINRALQPRKNGDKSLNLASADLTKVWGVVGDIYPRHRFERNSHQFRIKASKPEPEFQQAEVTICVYSVDRLVAVASATLETLADVINVPVVVSCVADEIAIAIDGAPEVTIEQLEIVEVTK